MFAENKYKKWYDLIIENAQNRKIDGYKERHHIIPRCMGGTNSKTNLVNLTAREHFVCHWLLTKFVDRTFYQKKMLNALGKFVQNSPLQERNLTSRQYEVARKAISEANKNRVYTQEIRDKMSKASKGRIPWNKGKTGLQFSSEVKKAKLRNLYKGVSFEERYGDRADEIKKKYSESKKGHTAGMTGKAHTDETKSRMSKNMKGKRGPQKRFESCPSCSQTQVTARHIKFCGDTVNCPKKEK